MNVSLVSITNPVVDGINSPEEIIVYCARVSNPNNQLNMPTAPRLIKYLIDNKHWSPFEMVTVCFEITTSRAIAQQILRHKSMFFQEFSQRYSQAITYEPVELREQASTNRQSSTDIVTDSSLIDIAEQCVEKCFEAYNILIENGVAKETARFILPLTTQTRLYMHGTLRSWIHYLQVRTDEHTQKEHREIALAIQTELTKLFPNVFEALNGNS